MTDWSAIVVNAVPQLSLNVTEITLSTNVLAIPWFIAAVIILEW
jgi:hypothetical protein